MIYWAPLFHFYQPPIQLHSVLKKVCEEAYLPLIEVFRQYPQARATINISGVLTELLYEHGFTEVINGLKELAEKGQIEFTGSAKYHPILPLLPKEEMKRQIQRNYLTNLRFFGEVYAPKGFFPPELAYSAEIIEPVIESRHQWIILSGVACPTDWAMDYIPQIAYNDHRIAVLFRDDVLSNKISFQSIDSQGFLLHLKGLRGKKERIYVVTAMDAETFGHHIQNWERLFLAEVYEALETEAYKEIVQSKDLAQQHMSLLAPAEEEIKVVSISELLNLFPRGRVVEPRPSSWSTSLSEIKEGNYYPLWKGKDNPIHRLQWEHLYITLDLVRKAEASADNETSRRFARIARGLFDSAVHSCQFWWASRKPWWDVNIVHKGLAQQAEALFNAYKSIKTSNLPESIKRDCYYKVIVARDLRNKISDLLLE